MKLNMGMSNDEIKKYILSKFADDEYNLRVIKEFLEQIRR